jgi:hypothetical protein
VLRIEKIILVLQKNYLNQTMMKKANFLMLFALIFLLLGCREELDYLNNENSSQSSYQLTKDNVKTQILHKQDYESRTFLKPSVSRIENFLNTSYAGNSSASKSTETINDYEIYTDTFEEVSYLDAKYSSFYIISDQKDGFEEKLVLKSINNQVTEKYIVKYKRLPDYSIDPSTYQTLKLEEKPGNEGSSLMINMEIFRMGCSEYIVTTYVCGLEDNHSGMTCPTTGEVIPHNTITVTFDPNCTSNSDAGAGPGVPGSSPGTGGSNGTMPGGNTPHVITLPTTAPLYIIQRPRGVICNPLDLNTEEISQINSNNNIKLRIYQYLAINGYNPSICNDLPINLELQVFVKALLNYTKDNPNIGIDELSLNFLDSVYKFIQDEYYDIEMPLEIFHRIKALDNALVQNPNLLLDMPCTEIDDWKTVANHPIPQSIKDKLKNINNNTHWYQDEFAIQNLDFASGPGVNMDLFPVRITSMPYKPGTSQKYTPAEFFDFFRRNVNDFAESFTPIVDYSYGIDDTALWFSNNPLGALIHIEIPGDNGTVICSGYNTQAWVFTTIKAPITLDGLHPVSGNRLFGYSVDSNGFMYLYTRGVDRFTKPVGNTAITYLAESFAFKKADELWKDMQTKLENYINLPQNGGLANKLEPKTYRPAYSKIKNYLKNKAPLSSLGCN